MEQRLLALGCESGTGNRNHDFPHTLHCIYTRNGIEIPIQRSLIYSYVMYSGWSSYRPQPPTALR